MKRQFGCVRSLGGACAWLTAPIQHFYQTLRQTDVLITPSPSPRTGEKHGSMIYWSGVALHPSCLLFHLDVALLFLPDSLFAFFRHSAGILVFLIKSQESAILRTGRDQTGACSRAFILNSVRDNKQQQIASGDWLLPWPTKAHRDAGVGLCFMLWPARIPRGTDPFVWLLAQLFFCVSRNQQQIQRERMRSEVGMTGAGGSSGTAEYCGMLEFTELRHFI